MLAVYNKRAERKYLKVSISRCAWDASVALFDCAACLIEFESIQRLVIWMAAKATSFRINEEGVVAIEIGSFAFHLHDSPTGVTSIIVPYEHVLDVTLCLADQR